MLVVTLFCASLPVCAAPIKYQESPVLKETLFDSLVATVDVDSALYCEFFRRVRVGSV